MVKERKLKSRKRPRYKVTMFDGGIFFLFSSWMLAQERPSKFGIRLPGAMFSHFSCVWEGRSFTTSSGRFCWLVNVASSNEHFLQAFSMPDCGHERSSHAILALIYLTVQQWRKVHTGLFICLKEKSR